MLKLLNNFSYLLLIFIKIYPNKIYKNQSTNLKIIQWINFFNILTKYSLSMITIKME